MDGLFLVLAILAPIAGFVLAARQEDAGFLRLIAGATLGGLTVGFLFAATTIAQRGGTTELPGALAELPPWAFLFPWIGFVIGVVGVLVRLLHRWLAAA